LRTPADSLKKNEERRHAACADSSTKQAALHGEKWTPSAAVFHCASFPLRSAFFHAKEEIMKKKIGVLVLGAALAFGMSTGAWAQGGGAGGGAGGAGGGAAGTGAGGNSAGSSVGGRGAPNAPSPNLNPSNPNTVPQSNETPVSPGTPGTSPGNSTH
jgi:hypothetical protein